MSKDHARYLIGGRVVVPDERIFRFGTVFFSNIADNFAVATCKSCLADLTAFSPQNSPSDPTRFTNSCTTSTPPSRTSPGTSPCSTIGTTARTSARSSSASRSRPRTRRRSTSFSRSSPTRSQRRRRTGSTKSTFGLRSLFIFWFTVFFLVSLYACLLLSRGPNGHLSFAEINLPGAHRER